MSTWISSRTTTFWGCLHHSWSNQFFLTLIDAGQLWVLSKHLASLASFRHWVQQVTYSASLVGRGFCKLCLLLNAWPKKEGRKEKVAEQPRADSPLRDGAWKKQVLQPSARGKRSDATSSKSCWTAPQNKQAVDASKGLGSCSQGQLPVCTLHCVLLLKVKAAALSLFPSPPHAQLQWVWCCQDSPGEDQPDTGTTIPVVLGEK